MERVFHAAAHKWSANLIYELVYKGVRLLAVGKSLRRDTANVGPPGSVAGRPMRKTCAP